MKHPHQDSAPHLTLQVNGEPVALPSPARAADPAATFAGCWTVAGLIEHLALEGRRVAVAVNRDVVPRSRYLAHGLRDGDRVEILEAVGGG